MKKILVNKMIFQIWKEIFNTATTICLSMSGMKRYVLGPASIAALAVVFATVTGTSLATTTVQTETEQFGPSSHITMIVYDADSNIKKYIQSDNLVPDTGEINLLNSVLGAVATPAEKYNCVRLNTAAPVEGEDTSADVFTTALGANQCDVDSVAGTVTGDGVDDLGTIVLGPTGLSFSIGSTATVASVTLGNAGNTNVLTWTDIPDTAVVSGDTIVITVTVTA